MKKLQLSIVCLVSICLNIHAQILEGRLYRENASPKVYVIHDGKKIHIPSPDALLALGYQWSDVQVVTTGSLTNYTEYIIRSASATPSSSVMRPLNISGGSLWPVKISNSQRIRLTNPLITDIHLVEIRGWLRDAINPRTNFGTLYPNGNSGILNTEGSGFDHCFELIPDWKWLDSQNMDISKIFMVGNIAGDVNEDLTGNGFSDKFVKKFLTVHCEISSWGWRDRFPPNLNHPPTDWSGFNQNNSPRSDFWAFNPNFSAGQYVSVFGSFVMDGAHSSKAVWHPASIKNPREELSKWCPGWPWACAYAEGPVELLANYTEIHPVDLIEPIDNRLQTETTFGIILTSNVGDCNSLSLNLSPDPSIVRPPNSVVAYREIIGAEWLDPNKNNLIKPPFYSPQFIRVVKSADHITVTANTCGNGTTSHGRIKALYSLWWEPAQRIPHEMNITVTPFPINLNSATTFTITASDIDINIPVNAEIFYNNIRIGVTNSTITYAFRPVRTRHVIIERDGRGKPHRTIKFINSYPPLEIRMPGYKSVTKRLL